MRCFPGSRAFAVWSVDEFTHPVVSAANVRSEAAAIFIWRFPFPVVRRGAVSLRELFVMRSLLVVIAVLALAQQAAWAEQRYAVVIGANPGWSSDRPLR